MLEATDIGRAPYDMQPEETSLAYRAFCTFRDLGAARTLGATLDLLSKGEDPPTQRTLNEWSSRYTWKARTAAWDAYLDKRNQDEQVRRFVEMQDRHIKEARLMQHIGASKLQQMAKKAQENPLREIDIHPSVAQQLISEGVRLERLAAGAVENQQKAPTIAVIIHYGDSRREVIDGEYTTVP